MPTQTTKTSYIDATHPASRVGNIVALVGAGALLWKLLLILGMVTQQVQIGWAGPGIVGAVLVLLGVFGPSVLSALFDEDAGAPSAPPAHRAAPLAPRVTAPAAPVPEAMRTAHQVAAELAQQERQRALREAQEVEARRQAELPRHPLLATTVPALSVGERVVTFDTFRQANSLLKAAIFEMAENMEPMDTEVVARAAQADAYHLRDDDAPRYDVRMLGAAGFAAA